MASHPSIIYRLTIFEKGGKQENVGVVPSYLMVISGLGLPYLSDYKTGFLSL